MHRTFVVHCWWDDRQLPQDSFCMARLLHDLSRKWNWRLTLGHCDHAWRPDSAANAQHIQRTAQDWGLPCVTRAAQEGSGVSEAAARRWRYEALTGMAEEVGCSYVTTGNAVACGNMQDTSCLALFSSPGKGCMTSESAQSSCLVPFFSRVKRTRLAIVDPGSHALFSWICFFR